MFNKEKRVDLSGKTVAEMIQELSKLPVDTKVYCCGCDTIYLHVSNNGDICCIDSENLEEEYR